MAAPDAGPQPLLTNEPTAPATPRTSTNSVPRSTMSSSLRTPPPERGPDGACLVDGLDELSASTVRLVRAWPTRTR